MPPKKPQPSANQPANTTAPKRPVVSTPKHESEKATGPAPLPPSQTSSLPQTIPKPRRKPRKLNREEGSRVPPNDNPTLLNNEILALKTRVRELEAQVEALYSRPSESPAPAVASVKPPRRRGRGRPLPGSEEALRKLETELQNAQEGLADLKAEERDSIGQGVKPPLEEDAEDIPRASGPTSEGATRVPGRAVTLTGSYRIPLPANVNMDDVRTIQSGIDSANKIARGIVDSRREQRSLSVQAAKTQGGASDTENKGWGEWIGGYSMSIARFVKDVEADAAVEQESVQNRPMTGARRRIVPVVEPAPMTLAQNERPKRPPARPHNSGSSGRMSQQQIKTLLA